MRSFFCLFLLISGSISYSQKTPDSTDEKLFITAVEYFKNKNLDSALAIWTRIADNRIGTESYIYGNSLFNIGIVYQQKKEFENAKALYNRILVSDVRDNDETGEMMEPHTNYKHKSAINMARLYYRDSNFKDALHWIWKADTVYRYWGFEGSATNVSKKQASLLGWKVHLLKKMNQPEQAVYEILSELLCSNELENFFSQEQTEFFTLIDKSAFKEEFDKAIVNLYLRERKKGSFLASFKFRGMNYVIPIQRVYPGELPHYWKVLFIGKEKPVTKEVIIQYIKQREFYKLLSADR